MDTALVQSSSALSQGISHSNGRFERKVYLTDLVTDRTFSGLLNFCVELSNGDVHISMADVSVYQYSSCMPLYNLSDLDLLRPKSVIFIEDAA